MLEWPQSRRPEPDREFMEQVISVSESLDSLAQVSSDACFDKAVRNTRDFFSVQRLHGFRQVVIHVQPQQKDEFVTYHARPSKRR